jgi:hypothetical protein
MFGWRLCVLAASVNFLLSLTGASKYIEISPLPKFLQWYFYVSGQLPLMPIFIIVSIVGLPPASTALLRFVKALPLISLLCTVAYGASKYKVGETVWGNLYANSVVPICTMETGCKFVSQRLQAIKQPECRAFNLGEGFCFIWATGSNCSINLFLVQPQLAGGDYERRLSVGFGSPGYPAPTRVFSNTLVSVITC